MIELTEPQVWTLIGVFSAVVFGMFTMVSTLFIRLMRSEFTVLRTELNAKFDSLDRDVQLLMRREFGVDRD